MMCVVPGVNVKPCFMLAATVSPLKFRTSKMEATLFQLEDIHQRSKVIRYCRSVYQLRKLRLILKKCHCRRFTLASLAKAKLAFRK